MCIDFCWLGNESSFLKIGLFALAAETIIMTLYTVLIKNFFQAAAFNASAIIIYDREFETRPVVMNTEG